MAIDLTTMTDEELATLASEVSEERSKRRRLEEIPERIAELADYYERDGGVKEELKASIDRVREPEPEVAESTEPAPTGTGR